MNSPSTGITTALERMLRPLARLLLRNGIAFADFTAIARRVFVSVAQEDFALPGRKQSVARVSVLTGINRKEVKRLLEETEIARETELGHNNRAARVISGWLRDTEFHDSKGVPLTLRFGPQSDDASAQASFEDLVKRYSGDMPSRAILDELVRTGAVERNEDLVTLAAQGYVPAKSNQELLRLSGEGVSDMLNTINHNLSDDKTHTRLQLSVAYDDLPQQGVDAFRNLSTEKSRELLVYLDKFLSTQDRTTNPAVQGDGKYRAGLGIYYFEEPNDDESVSNDAASEQQSNDAKK